MENKEVISIKQGSIIELSKKWIQGNAPLDFFYDPDATEDSSILTKTRFKLIKNRLEMIIKNINQVDKKLTKLNAVFRRKVSEALVFFLLDIVERDLKKTMDLFDEATECFVNAENYTDLKIKKHYIASGGWKLTCTKDLLNEIGRDFINAKCRFDLLWTNLAEVEVIPHKTRAGFEDVELLLIDIPPKLKEIRDEVIKLDEAAIEQL